MQSVYISADIKTFVISPVIPPGIKAKVNNFVHRNEDGTHNIFQLNYGFIRGGLCVSLTGENLPQSWINAGGHGFVGIKSLSMIDRHETSHSNFLSGLRTLPNGFVIPGTQIRIYSGELAHFDLLKDATGGQGQGADLLACNNNTTILYDKDNGYIGMFVDLSLMDAVHDETQHGPYKGSSKDLNDESRLLMMTLKKHIDKMKSDRRKRTLEQAQAQIHI
jgi:hypothetical protein